MKDVLAALFAGLIILAASALASWLVRFVLTGFGG